MLPATARAATVITEPFSSPEGGLPANWVLKKRGTAPDDIAQIATNNGQNALRLYRPDLGKDVGTSNYQAAVFYNGSTGDVTNGRMSDFTGSMIISLTRVNALSDTRGIVARAQSQAYVFNGYYLAVNPTGIGIWLNPASHIDSGKQLAFSAFENTLLANTDYRFEFSVLGSVLKAELWSINGGSLLGSVTVDVAQQYPTDPAYNEGYFGLRVGYGSVDNATYFRDLNLTVVPEPKAAFLLLVAGAAALGQARRFVRKG